MLEIFSLLFAWLPSGLQVFFWAVIVIFVLLFFVLLIAKIIELLH